MQNGATIAAGRPQPLRGIAFDGGAGIRQVEVSADGGATWTAATLGEDLGKYSFRGWQAPVTLTPGRYALKVRAVSNAGETQPADQPWNPAGYLRNLIETVTVNAA